MQLEQLWSKLARLSKPLTLKTRARGQEFEISYDSHYNDIVVTPFTTKMPRHILHYDFEKVWKKFKQIDGDPFRPGYYQRDTHNASYILAIIEHFLKGEKVE